MSGFVDRENEIFGVLQRFEAADLEFVVVGGYGVSAYQHRFSVDADLVIRSESLGQFTQILDEKGFEKDVDRDLDVYGGRYIAYVKNAELPVSIDLLVDGLQCRQTDASWGYSHFDNHSTQQKIEGSEKSVQVCVPTEELLIAVKLHSGRLTDTRDVVALIDGADLQTVERHIERGNREKLQQVLENVAETAKDPDFEDSFKGVFAQQALPEDDIQKLREFIDEQLK